MGYSEKEVVSFYPFVPYSYYLGALTAVAFIIFLLATRKHFMIEPPEERVS